MIDTATGVQAIETMKELYSLVDKKMFNCNPIAVAELMTATDEYWYCHSLIAIPIIQEKVTLKIFYIMQM
ncbi:MAG: hypothetical protein WDM90_06215 [Ferruginibacter sp.]